MNIINNKRIVMAMLFVVLGTGFKVTSALGCKNAWYACVTTTTRGADYGNRVCLPRKYKVFRGCRHFWSASDIKAACKLCTGLKSNVRGKDDGGQAAYCPSGECDGPCSTGTRYTKDTKVKKRVSTVCS